MMKTLALVATALLISSACDSARDGSNAELSGAASISETEIAAHLETLASDEFGGRGPSSPGEALTTAYLEDEFWQLGLEPGNGESFFQDVPLVDITADSSATLVVSGGGDPMTFAYADDFASWTTRVVEQSGVEDSDIVFVGYGIVAPEYEHDDYAGIDVTSKTVLILVNDPGYATQDGAVHRQRHDLLRPVDVQVRGGGAPGCGSGGDDPSDRPRRLRLGHGAEQLDGSAVQPPERRRPRETP